MLVAIDRLADRHEKKGARIFYTALKKQYENAANFIEKGGNIDGLVIRANPIRDAITSFALNTQLDSAKLQYLDLRKNNPVKAGIGTAVSTDFIKKIQAWILMNTGEKITKINDTTLDRIRTIHANAIAEGLGPRDIAALIRKASKSDFTAYRATVIARTESTRNASQGHLFGAQAWEKETGQKSFKQWSATNDSRTRDAHRAMLVLHIIRSEFKFVVGGVEMDFPGDPAGGAKNCVNCRCRVYYMSERLAMRKLGMEARESTAPRFKPAKIAEYESSLNIKVDESIFSHLRKQTPLRNSDKSGAYYLPSENYVNIPIRPGNKWKAESVVYHEYGHAIDWQHKVKERPEVKALMDKYRKIYSANDYELFNKLDKDIFRGGYKAYSENDQIGLSQHGAIDDTIMSLNYNYGRGHDKKYFKIEGRSEAEFVAHAFENKYIGNPIFKKFAPDLYEEMIEMLDSILAKL